MLLDSGRPARVVVAIRDQQVTVLDVVKGRLRHVELENLTGLGGEALVLSEPLAPAPSARRWYAPLWAEMRQEIAKLAVASLLVNIVALATPLFMMLVINRVIGHGPPGTVAELMLAAAHGREPGYGEQKIELLTIAGGAFGWRAIARELADAPTHLQGIAKAGFHMGWRQSIEEATEFEIQNVMKTVRHPHFHKMLTKFLSGEQKSDKAQVNLPN